MNPKRKSECTYILIPHTGAGHHNIIEVCKMLSLGSGGLFSSPVVPWANDTAGCLRTSQETVTRTADILLSRRGRSYGLVRCVWGVE